MELSLIRFNVKILCSCITFFISVQQLSADNKAYNLQMVGAEFSEVLKFADAKMWDKATKKVDVLNSSVAFDILQWLKLRAGTNDFSEYEAFLLLNDDWPGMGLLRTQGEKAINSLVKSNRIVNYFSHNKPLTANGSLKFAEALLLSQEPKKAYAVIQRSWVEHSYSLEELRQADELFGSFLEQYNVRRIDNLLWLGKVKQAEAMLERVPKDVRLLSNARIALRNHSVGVDKLVSKVPQHLKADPGLVFDRFSYRKDKNLHQGAEQILLDVSHDTEALGKPSFWINGRAVYARRALFQGQPDKAYKIAAHHFIDLSDRNVGKDAAELEWLAGFIAFQFFQDYERALKHFKKVFEVVVNPINLSKASYWIGRSHEKLLEKEEKLLAYSIGAKYQTTFYGQLSAERGDLPADQALVSDSRRHEWEGSEFMQDGSVQAAILLYYSGRSILADRFFNHASESLSLRDRLKLSQLVHDLGLKASQVSIAKTAGKEGMLCFDFSFPTAGKSLLIDNELQPLVTAVIRQESSFFTYTKSSAGALGLMQVMPRTASSMAKKLGLGFSEEKLLRDPKYNVKIGTHFLKTLLQKFDGSKVLSIAAYNAGPSRVREWIKQLGDPRSKDVDPLIWIELIPFMETRNYVKRVLEADWVYRGKKIGKPAQLNVGRRNFGHKF